MEWICALNTYEYLYSKNGSARVCEKDKDRQIKCVKYKIYMNFIPNCCLYRYRACSICHYTYLFWVDLECRHFIWTALNSFELFHSANWNNKWFDATLFVTFRTIMQSARCENLWQIEVRCVILFTTLYLERTTVVTCNRCDDYMFCRWREGVRIWNWIQFNLVRFDSIRYDSIHFISFRDT